MEDEEGLGEAEERECGVRERAGIGEEHLLVRIRVIQQSLAVGVGGGVIQVFWGTIREQLGLGVGN